MKICRFKNVALPPTSIEDLHRMAQETEDDRLSYLLEEYEARQERIEQPATVAGFIFTNLRRLEE